MIVRWFQDIEGALKLPQRWITKQSDSHQMFELPEVLTIADAAKELRCSKAHLAKVLNGQVPGLPDLPHLRLGRRKLIRRSMLYQWMAEVERAQSGMLSALPEVRAV
jgi:hypothetical protein